MNVNPDLKSSLYIMHVNVYDKLLKIKKSDISPKDLLIINFNTSDAFINFGNEESRYEVNEKILKMKKTKNKKYLDYIIMKMLKYLGCNLDGDTVSLYRFIDLRDSFIGIEINNERNIIKKIYKWIIYH